MAKAIHFNVIVFYILLAMSISTVALDSKDNDQSPSPKKNSQSLPPKNLQSRTSCSVTGSGELQASKQVNETNLRPSQSPAADKYSGNPIAIEKKKSSLSPPESQGCNSTVNPLPKKDSQSLPPKKYLQSRETHQTNLRPSQSPAADQYSGNPFAKPVPLHVLRVAGSGEVEKKKSGLSPPASQGVRVGSSSNSLRTDQLNENTYVSSHRSQRSNSAANSPSLQGVSSHRSQSPPAKRPSLQTLFSHRSQRSNSAANSPSLQGVSSHRSQSPPAKRPSLQTLFSHRSQRSNSAANSPSLQGVSSHRSQSSNSAANSPSLRVGSSSNSLRTDQLNENAYVASKFSVESHKIIFPGVTNIGIFGQLGQGLILSLHQHDTNQHQLQSMKKYFCKITLLYAIFASIYFCGRLMVRVIEELPNFERRNDLCLLMDELISIPAGLISIALMTAMFNELVVPLVIGLVFAFIWLSHVALLFKRNKDSSK